MPGVLVADAHAPPDADFHTLGSAIPHDETRIHTIQLIRPWSRKGGCGCTAHGLSRQRCSPPRAPTVCLCYPRSCRRRGAHGTSLDPSQSVCNTPLADCGGARACTHLIDRLRPGVEPTHARTHITHRRETAKGEEGRGHRRVCGGHSPSRLPGDLSKLELLVRPARADVSSAPAPVNHYR